MRAKDIDECDIHQRVSILNLLKERLLGHGIDNNGSLTQWKNSQGRQQSNEARKSTCQLIVILHAVSKQIIQRNFMKLVSIDTFQQYLWNIAAISRLQQQFTYEVEAFVRLSVLLTRWQ